MSIKLVAFALSASLALAACGDTGDDVATVDAPPSASNAATPATPAATASYASDTAQASDTIAVAAPVNDPLTRCASLGTGTERDACEMQARQGLDVQQQGVMDPNPPSPTTPTDQVAQDDDDGM